MLSKQPWKPRRTIVFVAFSGEEEGLLGSDYYVNHPMFPLANTVAMINMDMIGRLQDTKLNIGGVGTAPEWRAMIQTENSPDKMRAAAIDRLQMRRDEEVRYKVDPSGKNASSGYPIIIGANGSPIVTATLPKVSPEPYAPFILTLNEDGFGPSDHSSFYMKKIPVLFFFTGAHDDYHKPSDTAEKINYEGEARIVEFVARLIRDIDKSDQRPTYAVAKSDAQQRTGFRVYLGTIPNYADSSDGLKLDGVRDDSPAARAGLKAGDKVVKLAGRDVKNVYDYTYALGEMRGGQEYEVVVMRDGQRLTMKITPETRK
jgi:Zn-dependent M28 family amino/carboxypeptidase